MNEEEFRRLLKEEEDMREKSVHVSSRVPKGTVVQLNVNMEEIIKKFEQYIEEMEKDDGKIEFYFDEPAKKTRKRKKFWDMFKEERK